MPEGLVFVTRSRCSLCDAAWELIADQLGSTPVRVIDVDEAPEVAEYGSRVPVLLTADGTVVVEGQFDSKQLRRRLRRL